jgi:hypothetical protein
MGRHHDGSLPVGATVEMLLPTGAGSFEPAPVIDHPTETVLGLVLEVQFTDSLRMQRMWLSSATRFA